jgi:hypothetical protein
LTDNDVIVKLYDLPSSVHGLIRQNGDGTYTVLLNSRDSRERNLATYKHELDHLRRDDFQPGDVSKQEADAHKK